MKGAIRSENGSLLVFFLFCSYSLLLCTLSTTKRMHGIHHDIIEPRFPKCKFILGDILLPNDMASIRAVCEKSMVGSAPSIICIDVNGNREIDGVIECLNTVMKEPWRRQPRMIIVKSRFLYWEVKKLKNNLC
jgi:hypothetical protein